MKRNIFFAWIILCTGFSGVTRADLAFVRSEGEGARAFALGNNYVALSGDQSAMFWNPAGFAFVPAREFQISFDGLYQAAQSTFYNGPNSSATPLARPRLGNIGYLHAFPTVQGGFTLAGAYHSPFVFDDVQKYSGTYQALINDTGIATIKKDKNHKAYGSLDMWSAGFGLQVTEGLGIGAAVSLVTGGENISEVYYKTTNNAIAKLYYDDYDGTYNRSYIGYDIRLGAMYSYKEMLRLGLRLVLPQTIWFTEDMNETYPHSGLADETAQYTGKLLSSYSGAFGGAVVFRYLTASAEVRARAPYGFAYPSEFISDTSLAGKTRLGAGIGLEAPVFVSTILVRGGFSWDQYDTHVFALQYDRAKTGWEPQGVSPVGDKLMGTIGMGFILKNVCLEWAYGYSLWKQNTSKALDETLTAQRLIASLSVRF